MLGGRWSHITDRIWLQPVVLPLEVVQIKIKSTQVHRKIKSTQVHREDYERTRSLGRSRAHKSTEKIMSAQDLLEDHEHTSSPRRLWAHKISWKIKSTHVFRGDHEYTFFWIIREGQIFRQFKRTSCSSCTVGGIKSQSVTHTVYEIEWRTCCSLTCAHFPNVSTITKYREGDRTFSHWHRMEKDDSFLNRKQ